jgi:hypothetical protein
MSRSDSPACLQRSRSSCKSQGIHGFCGQVCGKRSGLPDFALFHWPFIALPVFWAVLQALEIKCEILFTLANA